MQSEGCCSALRWWLRCAQLRLRAGVCKSASAAAVSAPGSEVRAHAARSAAVARMQLRVRVQLERGRCCNVGSPRMPCKLCCMLTFVALKPYVLMFELPGSASAKHSHIIEAECHDRECKKG